MKDDALDEDLTEIDPDLDPLDEALSTEEGARREDKLAAIEDEVNYRDVDRSDENMMYGQVYAEGVDEADTAERRDAQHSQDPDPTT